MQEFMSLAQYGLAGVSIALVGVLFWVIRFILKLSANHIDHNTEVINKMNITTEKNNTAVDNLSEAIISLKELIKERR